MSVREFIFHITLVFSEFLSSSFCIWYPSLRFSHNAFGREASRDDPNNGCEGDLDVLTEVISVESRMSKQQSWGSTFPSPEPKNRLACSRDRELWLDPIFWVCAEFSFRILNQSDLQDLTRSTWIADFRCWTKPELSIPATGPRKDREAQWSRWCFISAHFPCFLKPIKIEPVKELAESCSFRQVCAVRNEDQRDEIAC